MTQYLEKTGLTRYDSKIKEFINNNLDNQISFDKMNIKLVVKNKEEE